MCRICLVEDVKMHCLVNTELQNIYQKLTSMTFKTDDVRPLQVCYICCARLRNCYRLQLSCIRSEELFNEMLTNKLKPTPLQNMVTLKRIHPLVQLGCVPVTLEDTDQHQYNEMNNIKMKEEDFEVTETHIVGEKLIIHGIEPADTSWFKIVDVKTVNNQSNYNNRSVGSGDYNSTMKCDESYIKDDSIETTETIHSNNIDVLKKLPRKRVKVASKMCCLETNESVYQRPKRALKIKIESKPSTKLKAPLKKNTKLTTVRKTEDDYISPRKKKDRKIYYCGICGKDFNQNGHLMDHIRIHTGEKPYKCDTCEKCFSRKSHLLTHIPTHSRVKPYTCDVCDKSFKRKTNLNQHLRVHTLEKPFKCDTCDKYYKTKQHLLRHISIHNGEKLFKCDVCDKSFTQKVSLSLHIRRKRERGEH